MTGAMAAQGTRKPGGPKAVHCVCAHVYPSVCLNSLPQADSFVDESLCPPGEPSACGKWELEGGELCICFLGRVMALGLG